MQHLFGPSVCGAQLICPRIEHQCEVFLRINCTTVCATAYDAPSCTASVDVEVVEAVADSAKDDSDSPLIITLSRLLYKIGRAHV